MRTNNGAVRSIPGYNKRRLETSHQKWSLEESELFSVLALTVTKNTILELYPWRLEEGKSYSNFKLTGLFGSVRKRPLNIRWPSVIGKFR